ncbi:MAG: cysteine peptidase family C39 domain-containing protein, partial [Planctomycetota bacterium]
LETTGVILIAVFGVIAGRAFSRFGKPYWVLGYILPGVLIAMLAMVRFNSNLYFVSPFSWIAVGRVRYVVLSLAVAMGLTVPLSRLPYKFEKLIVCLLMAGFVAWFSVLPFLMPALIKERLSNLQTKFDKEGNCRQTTDYTCGPAAAVTALKQLGLTANEGELAVLSYSSPVTGTLPSCLSYALQDRFGAEGLSCRYRRFDSIAQLKNAGITLALVKEALFMNHCIAVLEVTDEAVTVADPVTGTRLMPYEQFEKIWRFSGIVLERNPLQSI